MDITWKRSQDYLVVGARKVPCSCNVRTLADGTRRREACEVVKTLPHGKPYDPVRFPVGTWSVTDVRPRQDSYRYPFFIATTAYADVPVWSLDDKGAYKEVTSETDRDWDYGMHFSSSNYTRGCVRISTEADLRWLVDAIKQAKDDFEPVRLIVTD